jgi:hypothetical protein
MRVAVSRTVYPSGKVKEHDNGMDVLEIRKPLSDLGFNLRVKNVTRQINQIYKIK